MSTTDPNEEVPPPPQVSAEFWDWIDLMGGIATKSSTDLLIQALQTAGPEAIDVFERDFDIALGELASEAHVRRAERIGAEDDDTFEVIRLEVIAAGESAWHAAIANPRLLGKHTARMVGEYLSTVVYLAKGGE